MTGVDVTDEVSEHGEELEEDGDPPTKTCFILSSPDRCKSRYTLKLGDSRPPVRIISDNVEPDRKIAVAAPRLKQWEE